MKYFLLFLVTAVPAYVFGSVNGAIITSTVLFHKDIRDFGSGNPGLTNFYRVFGKAGALLVVFIDVAKTVGPVILGGWLFGRVTDTALSDAWLFRHFFDVSVFGMTFAGFFVMLGHCFPLFYKFKGGKGVMTAGAILIVLDWRLALISWGAFILLTALTRYVSLAAIVGAVLYPISQIILSLGGFIEVTMGVMCVLLLVARHSPNISRLIKGEERKFSFRQ